jgi:dTDP-4-dehydrorhamnose reductase
MNIALTGSHGLFGQSVLKLAQDKHHTIVPIEREIIDFKNPQALKKLLNECDVLIHAAANTNVEQCEIDSDDCYRDNTLLTEYLSHIAYECDVKIVYISSTGIYGNYQDSAYSEYDDVKPTTHHHRAKRLGEQGVLRYPNSLVLRTGWLFGGDPENRKNFVARRIEEALKADGFIESNNEQLGCPSYVDVVVRRTLEFISDDRSGIYNCINEGTASRFEYVSKIVELANFDVEVRPSSATAFNRKAKVSHNETAINLKSLQCGYESMPHWEESLGVYITKELSEWIEKVRV